MFINRLRHIAICASTLLCTQLAVGQLVDPGVAKEHFKHHNYLDAIPEFKKLVKVEPKNADYHHKLGYCYIHTQIDKTLAIRPLEKATALPKCDPEAYYDLGKAYTFDYEFDKAIEAFSKYKAKASGDDVKKADLAIENCNTAKELMKYPLNVTFTNMGNKINTPYPDYYPYVSKNGEVFVFTSRRKANKGGGREIDGYYASDIWMVKSAAKGYSPAKNISLNSAYDEQAVGITDDGSTIFVYFDDIQNFGDIYKSTRKGTKFGRKVKLDPVVNSNKLETSASMSADGQTLFFTSARPGGYGGLDLYKTRMLPTGNWAEPQNLGPEINTPYDEGFPTLSYDNKTLFFCSEGHPGMGGIDLFKTEWDVDANTFSKPKNLGYPINTPEDNRTISFTEDGKHAFVSALRKGGYGDYDIYKVTYNDVDITPAIFTFHLMTGDSTSPFAKQGTVYLFDQNGDEVGVYAPNPNSGKIVMALMPGKYSMEIEADGYEMKNEDLVVTDFHLRVGEIKKQIALSH